VPTRAPQSVSAEAVVERLERLAVEAPSNERILAFDADGTLWSGDIGNDLFEALLLERAIRPEAHEALLAEARDVGIAAEGSATDIARALWDALLAGQYDEARAFGMMAWAFAGYSLTEVRQFAARVFAAKNLESRQHTFLEPIFAWARREDVQIWVVSASPWFGVEVAVAPLGILPAHIIAMRPRQRGDTILPGLAAPAVYGPAKPESLFAACPGKELLAAFGDSSYDAALLAASRIPVAVRPKPGLLAKANEVPDLLVLGI
jgi:phosphatidylglycerophosphatase C